MMKARAQADIKKVVTTEEVLNLLEELRKLNEDYKRLWVRFDKAVFEATQNAEQLKLDFDEDNT